MESITFYVGILPEDKAELLSFVSSLNEEEDPKRALVILEPSFALVSFILLKENMLFFFSP